MVADLRILRLDISEIHVHPDQLFSGGGRRLGREAVNASGGLVVYLSHSGNAGTVHSLCRSAPVRSSKSAAR